MLGKKYYCNHWTGVKRFGFSAHRMKNQEIERGIWKILVICGEKHWRFWGFCRFWCSGRDVIRPDSHPADAGSPSFVECWHNKYLCDRDKYFVDTSNIFLFTSPDRITFYHLIKYWLCQHNKYESFDTSLNVHILISAQIWTSPTWQKSLLFR